MVQEAVNEWKSKSESLQNDLSDLSAKFEDLRNNQPQVTVTDEVTVIEDIRKCLVVIESHAIESLGDKWRMELKERIFAILDRLVAKS